MSMLTEAQAELLAKKLVQCLPSDRDAIMDFLADELCFASAKLPADDATFIAALQVSLDAESSRDTDDEGIVPYPRKGLDNTRIYERMALNESFRVAPPLPPERQAAVAAAKYRRLSPEERASRVAYEAADADGQFDVGRPLTPEATKIFWAGFRLPRCPTPA
jgi:hypothetical protein